MKVIETVLDVSRDDLTILVLYERFFDADCTQWSYSRKCPLPRISKTKVKTFWLISPEPEVQKSIVNIQDDGIVVQILKMVNFFSNKFFFYLKKNYFAGLFEKS